MTSANIVTNTIDGVTLSEDDDFWRLMKASVSPNVSVHMENSVGSTSQKAFLSNVYNSRYIYVYKQRYMQFNFC